MVEIPKTHRAARLHYPGYDVRVEELESPKIEKSGDVIVKVKLAGLCGSDMHTYRGHSIPKDPFIMGHEFIGEVVALGEDHQSGGSSSLNLGDFVVSPFTSSCGKCSSCRLGYTSRCKESLLFGHPLLPGAQAQYVRVPNAAATLFKIPPDSAKDPNDQARWKALAPESLILLADILPTGCFGALQALQHPNILPLISGRPYPLSSPLQSFAQVPGATISQLEQLTDAEKRLTIGIVGLGPVGLCALVALLHLLDHYECKDFQIVAVDLVEARRQKAQRVVSQIGNINGVVKCASPDEAKVIVKDWTEGVGCSAVIEVVGYNPALTLSYELIRPFGVIASVGVHQTETIPLTGAQCYAKNVSLVFGRCPVRSMFPMALDVLLARQDVFAGVGMETSLVDRIVGMSDANVKANFEAFDKGRCGKVLFDPWKL